MTRTDDTPVPDYPGAAAARRQALRRARRGPGDRAAGVARARVGAARGVFCVDVDPDLASDIADEVDGIRALGDATNRDDVERLFADATATLGGIDGVVDIVGMARYADLADDHRRRLGLALRHRAAPRVPRHAASAAGR